jgi:nitrogen fixation protein NifU and related proteins
MSYTPQVLDHFEHPRNSGEMPSPDIDVRVENPACGDQMRLMLQIEGGLIQAARFQTRGCVAAIAAGSALTELATGRTLAEAARLTREQIVAALGGLSPESMHASHLAIDALQQALSRLPNRPQLS